MIWPRKDRKDGADSVSRVVWLAKALDGDPVALHRVTEELPVPTASRHRLAPALALRASSRADHPTVQVWRDELRLIAGHQMLLEDALSRVGQTLGRADICWLPFKGCDLVSRLYERPEERPFGDLDILLREQDLGRACQALEDAGWRPLRPSLRNRVYLEHEGYAWQALDAAGVLLEVHFRLWGWLPPGAVDACIERSLPSPVLGATARRLCWADAFVLSALHLWLDPPPRALGRVWELERLVQRFDEADTAAAIAKTEQFGVQLPVALALEAVRGLWPEALICREIRDALLSSLRWPETWVFRVRRRNPLATPFASLALARLLAGRPSRSGWRALWRKIWPHPSLVEQGTPEIWSWPRRRLWFFLRSLPLGRKIFKMEPTLESLQNLE